MSTVDLISDARTVLDKIKNKTCELEAEGHNSDATAIGLVAVLSRRDFRALRALRPSHWSELGWEAISDELTSLGSSDEDAINGLKQVFERWGIARVRLANSNQLTSTDVEFDTADNPQSGLNHVD